MNAQRLLSSPCGIGASRPFGAKDDDGVTADALDEEAYSWQIVHYL